MAVGKQQRRTLNLLQGKAVSFYATLRNALRAKWAIWASPAGRGRGKDGGIDTLTPLGSSAWKQPKQKGTNQPPTRSEMLTGKQDAFPIDAKPPREGGHSCPPVFGVGGQECPPSFFRQPARRQYAARCGHCLQGILEDPVDVAALVRKEASCRPGRIPCCMAKYLIGRVRHFFKNRDILLAQNEGICQKSHMAVVST